MTVQEMLIRLFKRGISQADVAQRCATTQPSISRAANGATVRYEVGKAIELLLVELENGADIAGCALTLNQTIPAQRHHQQAGCTAVQASSTTQAIS